MLDLKPLLKRFKLPSTKTNFNARLFFYTDGFQLSAAVIAREGDRLNILASAQPAELTEDTLSNVLAELSTQVTQLPDRAIMLHSRMALGLLDLPISDNKQLTEDKIANIVRWEMETLHSEQAPQWSIGSLLVQMGIISETERDAVVKTQQENRHRAASLGGKLPKFGDIVISQGKLDQQTLDKYLALQNEMQQAETAVQCGWYRSDKDAPLFCAAMGATEQVRWIQLFNGLNLRIDRFYPVTGSLSALIPPEPLQGVLELHSNSLVYSVLEQGVLKSMEIVNTLAKSLTVAELLRLIDQQENPLNSLYLWGDHPRTEILFEQLQAQLDQPSTLLQWPADNLTENQKISPEPFLFPLLGIAKDYFFQQLNNGRLPYVIGMPPLPKFYQQRKWQVVLALFLSLLLMFGSSFYFNSQVTQAKNELERLKDNYKTLKKTNKKIKSKNRQYSRLNKEYVQLKNSFSALQVQKKAVEVNLIERQKFMRAFLPLLIKSIDQNVVLDSLTEDNWYQFRIMGWALNLAAVSRFEKSLTRHLGVFEMIISQSPSRLLSSGELVGAYRFDFQLIRKRK